MLIHCVHSENSELDHLRRIIVAAITSVTPDILQRTLDEVDYWALCVQGYRR